MKNKRLLFWLGFAGLCSLGIFLGFFQLVQSRHTVHAVWPSAISTKQKMVGSATGDSPLIAIDVNARVFMEKVRAELMTHPPRTSATPSPLAKLRAQAKTLTQKIRETLWGAPPSGPYDALNGNAREMMEKFRADLLREQARKSVSHP
jgi:hypothetical protein